MLKWRVLIRIITRRRRSSSDGHRTSASNLLTATVVAVLYKFRRQRISSRNSSKKSLWNRQADDKQYRGLVVHTTTIPWGSLICSI